MLRALMLFKIGFVCLAGVDPLPGLVMGVFLKILKIQIWLFQQTFISFLCYLLQTLQMPQLHTYLLYYGDQGLS